MHAPHHMFEAGNVSPVLTSVHQPPPQRGLDCLLSALLLALTLEQRKARASLEQSQALSGHGVIASRVIVKTKLGDVVVHYCVATMATRVQPLLLVLLLFLVLLVLLLWLVVRVALTVRLPRPRRKHHLPSCCWCSCSSS